MIHFCLKQTVKKLKVLLVVYLMDIGHALVASEMFAPICIRLIPTGNFINLFFRRVVLGYIAFHMALGG